MNYAVRITSRRGSHTFAAQYIIQSDNVVDSVAKLPGAFAPSNKTEYVPLGVVATHFHGKRSFYSAAQLTDYLAGYNTGRPATNHIKDLSWLGVMDAMTEEDERQARREAAQ